MLLGTLASIVGLILLGVWVYRLEDESGVENLWAFLPLGMLYTVTFGIGCAWVRSQLPGVGVVLTAASTLLVAGGVRQLAGYFGFQRIGSMPTACAAAAVGFLWSTALFSERFFLMATRVKTVDVRELPGESGGAFEVRGAVPRLDLESSRNLDEAGAMRRYARVMPLVYEGWTPESPVPAWLVCRSGSSIPGECALREGVRFVVIPTGLDDGQGTSWIEQTERLHQLRSAPGARLFARSDDARAEYPGALGLGLMLPVGLLVVFGLVAVFGRRWDEYKPPG
jgi:hypothetical protein